MKLKNDQIQIVRHAGRDGRCSNPLHQVAYLKYGDAIVFTGLYCHSAATSGSTLMFAAEIVTAIAQATQVSPKKATFYDLQTFVGYPGKFGCGQYRFSEVLLHWYKGDSFPITPSWIDQVPDAAGKTILIDFTEFIWGDSPVGTPRNMLKQNYVPGFIPSRSQRNLVRA